MALDYANGRIVNRFVLGNVSYNTVERPEIYQGSHTFNTLIITIRVISSNHTVLFICTMLTFYGDAVRRYRT